MTNLAQDTRTLCQDDPELFFAPDRESHTNKQWREKEAKALCAACPALVRLDCLNIALAAENGNTAQHREGIYGGLTPTERAALEGKGAPPKPPAKCGTAAGYGKHRRRGEKACDDCKAAESQAATARRKHKVDAA